VLLPRQQAMLARGAKDKEHAVSEKGESAFRNAVIGGREVTLRVNRATKSMTTGCLILH
jgi:hypothetical protein